MRFAGKTAIITGGARGIGAAISARLASEGANVLITDRDEAAARVLEKSIAANGGTAEAFSLDVMDRARAEAAVSHAAERWGGVQILVNNAGVMDRAPFLEMTDDFWWGVQGINLYGTFVVSQTVARRMVDQGRTDKGKGGRIINVASNSGLFGGRGRAAYGASKAGMINLTQTMAIELAEHGIAFGEPKVDLDKLRAFKGKVVGKLTGGLASMADIAEMLKPEYAMLEGAISGRALYDGRIDPAAALEQLRKAPSLKAKP